MKYFLITLFFLLSFATQAGATTDPEIQNAGFVPANIWYSKDPFFAGDTIRVYTVIFNGSSYNLTGTAEFLDNGIVIGRVNFTVTKGGHVQDVSVPWKTTEGKHIITAHMVNVVTREGVKKSSIALENAETGKSERIVDLDTDADGVGNTEDPDDDNDGVPDIDEIRNGTDPLKKDTNGNGISDKQELDLAEKRAAAERSATSTSAAQKGSIAGTIKTVESAIPVPVKEGVAQGANIIEQFRAGEGYQFKLAKEEKAREIASIKAREDAVATSTSQKSVSGATDSMLNVAEKPFAYILFAIYTALQYFFEWQILFYGVTAYILYRLVKLMIRRRQNR